MIIFGKRWSLIVLLILIFLKTYYYRYYVKSLIRFSCVSKLWFCLIIKDQQFNKFYMVESKKKPIFIFTFKDCEAKRWYYMEKQHLNTYAYVHKLIVYGKHKYMNHQYMIGYSNGLACYPNYSSTKDSEWTYLSLQIPNPSRIEKLIFVSCFEA